jgi:cytochrome P450
LKLLLTRNPATFQRGATVDLILPDGTFIPKGTKLYVNTVSIHVDEKHYEKPLDFDGLRYYKMRQAPGQENKHMCYSVGLNDLSFGFGRYVCLGRYPGHLNIKLVLSELLVNYDLALLNGAKLPKSVYFEALVSSLASDPLYLPKSMLISL